MSTGHALHEFASRLFPVCRSISGEGVRHTLQLIGEMIPLHVSEVPSGTPVFDWIVPNEWNIADAYIKDGTGRRVVDFRQSNLHIMSYSAPVRDRMPLEKLKEHLFTLPDRPDWIPYRTSYYREDWGFCLSHKQLQEFTEGEYEVCIDSSLAPGSLTYGECVLPGESPEEFLISCHVCHPSLANDNLSGIAVAAFLARSLQNRRLRHTYRFLFIPGTIGAITWLARNQDRAFGIRHGLVLTCIGDSGGFHYKKSRRGDADIDRAVGHALRHCGEPWEVLDFSPYGYDERQYCSPGFNLPVGCLMRSPWGSFPEYHTSADNLAFIRPERLAGSLQLLTEAVLTIEGNRAYQSLNPFCEPQLGRRNLYRAVGGESLETEISARLWVLNYSDGTHSLLDIAEKSGLAFPMIRRAADLLLESGLLAVVEGPAEPERTHFVKT
ncbi:MAG: DUF4910 domain-containing protein [Bryobacterales bacterium]|nr:DUF4910 domain-containing protein [Bryobacterales bacterium]